MLIGLLPAAQAEVLRCTELPNIIEMVGSRLEEKHRVELERYFIREDNIGGRDCWVHKRQGQGDVIITPNSWGNPPKPGKKKVIDEAFESIRKSREVYRELGQFNCQN